MIPWWMVVILSPVIKVTDRGDGTSDIEGWAGGLIIFTVLVYFFLVLMPGVSYLEERCKFNESKQKYWTSVMVVIVTLVLPFVAVIFYAIRGIAGLVRHYTELPKVSPEEMEAARERIVKGYHIGSLEIAERCVDEPVKNKRRRRK